MDKFETVIKDIRGLRDTYRRCASAAYSRSEYRLGEGYSDVADDLDEVLVRVGGNT